MTKSVMIFGLSEVAKLSHYYFCRDGLYKTIAFVVDEEYKDREKFCSEPVVSITEALNLYPPGSCEIFIAVGPSRMNQLRVDKFTQIKSLGYKFASCISSNSIVHSKLGENCLVADNVIINPFSKIGANNFFWEGALICNDASIGDHCYFSPYSVISSYANIQDQVVVGTHSVIKARVDLAPKTLVGACCYISGHTSPKSIYGSKGSKSLGNISDKIDISR